MNAATAVVIVLVVPWTAVVSLAVLAYRRQQRRRADRFVDAAIAKRYQEKS